MGELEVDSEAEEVHQLSMGWGIRKKRPDTRALRRPIQVENSSIRPLTSSNSIVVVPERSCYAQVTGAGRDSSRELHRNKNMAPFGNQRLSNIESRSS